MAAMIRSKSVYFYFFKLESFFTLFFYWIPQVLNSNMVTQLLDCRCPNKCQVGKPGGMAK